MKINPAECKLFGRIQTPSESEHSNRVHLICIEYLLNIKVIKNIKKKNILDQVGLVNIMPDDIREHFENICWNILPLFTRILCGGGKR